MNSECIEWGGALNSGGYPVTWKNGKPVYAHRVAVNAQEGQVVNHSCDNPKCVNPAHLVIGTHASNSLDMVLKNRQAKGEACGNAKLKEEDVINIRSWKGKAPSRTVSKIFSISKTNVLDIWNNKIWSHI